MAISVVELRESRTTAQNRKGYTVTRVYMVRGTDNPAVARAFGPPMNQVYADGEVLLDCWVSQKQAKIVKLKDAAQNGLCQLTVTYDSPEQREEPPPGENEYEFSTMAQSEHIERAYAQIHYPGSANVGDLIGVQKDDTIEGVDKYVPKGAITAVRYFDTLSSGYKELLMALTGCINSSIFVIEGTSWNPYEVLFLGARASRRGSSPWRIEYSFAVEPTETIQIATQKGGVQTISKPGWDYLWVRKAKITSGTELRHVVDSAHLAIVYADTNLNQLGL